MTHKKKKENAEEQQQWGFTEATNSNMGQELGSHRPNILDHMSDAEL